VIGQTRRHRRATSHPVAGLVLGAQRLLEPASESFHVVRTQRSLRGGKVRQLHVGVIRGGTALNIVPRDCVFEFEIRHLPFDDPDAFFADVERHAHSLLPAMQAVDPATFIEFDHLSTLPGFDDDGESQIADIGRACNESHDMHKVSFGAEAALFHNAGMPAVICGPGHIQQAHQPNEWVSLEQLARCEAFMRRLAEHVCVA